MIRARPPETAIGGRHTSQWKGRTVTEPVDNMPPRAFMSYSQHSRAHDDWVLNLATRLRTNGIDVLLDRWDLDLGSNLPLFMEGLIDGDWVLAICSSCYVVKATNRYGGVGYESMILTGNLSGSGTLADHVIPILRDNESSNLVPPFLSSARYLDMRSDDDHEDGYQQLLRRLHNRPEVVRPPLGPNPYTARAGELQLPVSMQASRYVSAQLEGEVEFPYASNNGRYVLGSGTHTFTTKWSAAGHGSIYGYADAEDVYSVALAADVRSINKLDDAATYDASSRVRHARVGDVLVWRNTGNYFAATLIEAVTTRDTGGERGSRLRFSYRILGNHATSFSRHLKD